MKSSFNVLIVDDEADIRDLIRDGIRDNAQNVYEAENGKMALEVIATKKIDIVFSDVKMPEMDGVELLRELREMDNDVVFILVTGFSDKEVATSALQWGAYDIIEKPFKMSELEATFERARIKCSFEAENERLIDEFIASKLGDRSPAEIDPAELEKLRDISKSILEFKRIKYRRNS